MVQHLRRDLEQLGLSTPMLRYEQLGAYLQLTPEELEALVHSGVISGYELGPHRWVHLEQFLQEIRAVTGTARVVEQGPLGLEAPPAALPAPEEPEEPEAEEETPAPVEAPAAAKSSTDEPARLYPGGPVLHPPSVKRNGKPLAVPVIYSDPGAEYFCGTEDLAQKLNVSYATMLEWLRHPPHGKLGPLTLEPGHAAEWVYATTGRARNRYCIRKDVVELFLLEYGESAPKNSYTARTKAAPAKPTPMPFQRVAEPKLAAQKQPIPMPVPVSAPARTAMEEAMSRAIDTKMNLDPDDVEEARRIPGVVGMEVRGKNAAMRWTGLTERTFDRQVEAGLIHPQKKLIDFNYVTCYSRIELDPIRRQLHPKYADRQGDDYTPVAAQA